MKKLSLTLLFPILSLFTQGLLTQPFVGARMAVSAGLGAGAVVRGGAPARTCLRQ